MPGRQVDRAHPDSVTVAGIGMDSDTSRGGPTWQPNPAGTAQGTIASRPIFSLRDLRSCGSRAGEGRSVTISRGCAGTHILLTVLGGVLCGNPARATIDMSGPWRVRQISHVPYAALPERDISVVQVGTTLTFDGLPGTIDPITGVFSASPAPPNECGYFAISGTVAPSGRTFTTAEFYYPYFFFHLCDAIPVTMDGRRCGNGVLEAGEVCDDHNTYDGDCCDSTCQVELPAGASCRFFYDDPSLAGSEACTDAVCDAAAQCVVMTTHPDGTSCDDGIYCDGADTCVAGRCTQHAGDPCAGGPACNTSCNESFHDCATPPGDSCPDDGDQCTIDYCDGFGTCVHSVAAGNGQPCADDGLACTQDVCSDDVCTHPFAPAGTPCRPVQRECDVAETCTGTSATCPDDALAPLGARTTCPLCEACNEAHVCAPFPQLVPACSPPSASGASRLVLHNQTPDTGDRLSWRWKGSLPNLFFTPPTSRGFALCGYDVSGGTPARAFALHVPVSCGTASCWGETLGRWHYRDPAGSSDGIDLMDARLDRHKGLRFAL